MTFAVRKTFALFLALAMFIEPVVPVYAAPAFTPDQTSEAQAPTVTSGEEPQINGSPAPAPSPANSSSDGFLQDINSITLVSGPTPMPSSSENSNPSETAVVSQTAAKLFDLPVSPEGGVEDPMKNVDFLATARNFLATLKLDESIYESVKKFIEEDLTAETSLRTRFEMWSHIQERRAEIQKDETSAAPFFERLRGEASLEGESVLREYYEIYSYIMTPTHAEGRLLFDNLENVYRFSSDLGNNVMTRVLSPLQVTSGKLSDGELTYAEAKEAVEDISKDVIYLEAVYESVVGQIPAEHRSAYDQGMIQILSAMPAEPFSVFSEAPVRAGWFAAMDNLQQRLLSGEMPLNLIDTQGNPLNDPPAQAGIKNLLSIHLAFRMAEAHRDDILMPANEPPMAFINSSDNENVVEEEQGPSELEFVSTDSSEEDEPEADGPITAPVLTASEDYSAGQWNSILAPEGLTQGGDPISIEIQRTLNINPGAIVFKNGETSISSYPVFWKDETMGYRPTVEFPPSLEYNGIPVAKAEILYTSNRAPDDRPETLVLTGANDEPLFIGTFELEPPDQFILVSVNTNASALLPDPEPADLEFVSTDAEDPEPAATPSEDHEGEVAFSGIYHTYYSHLTAFGGVTKGFKVTGEEQYSTLWNDLIGAITFDSNMNPIQAPAVDFSVKTVLAIVDDQHMTGGHDITVSGITRNGNKLTVKVKKTSPAIGGMVMLALSRPLQMVVVNNSDLNGVGEVEFVTEEGTVLSEIALETPVPSDSGSPTVYPNPETSEPEIEPSESPAPAEPEIEEPVLDSEEILPPEDPSLEAPEENPDDGPDENDDEEVPFEEEGDQLVALLQIAGGTTTFDEVREQNPEFAAMLLASLLTLAQAPPDQQQVDRGDLLRRATPYASNAIFLIYQFLDDADRWTRFRNRRMPVLTIGGTAFNPNAMRDGQPVYPNFTAFQTAVRNHLATLQNPQLAAGQAAVAQWIPRLKGMFFRHDQESLRPGEAARVPGGSDIGPNSFQAGDRFCGVCVASSEFDTVLLAGFGISATIVTPDVVNSRTSVQGRHQATLANLANGQVVLLDQTGSSAVMQANAFTNGAANIAMGDLIYQGNTLGTMTYSQVDDLAAFKFIAADRRTRAVQDLLTVPGPLAGTPPAPTILFLTHPNARIDGAAITSAVRINRYWQAIAKLEEAIQIAGGDFPVAMADGILTLNGTRPTSLAQYRAMIYVLIADELVNSNRPQAVALLRAAFPPVGGPASAGLPDGHRTGSGLPGGAGPATLRQLYDHLLAQIGGADNVPALDIPAQGRPVALPAVLPAPAPNAQPMVPNPQPVQPNPNPVVPNPQPVQPNPDPVVPNPNPQPVNPPPQTILQQITSGNVQMAIATNNLLSVTRLRIAYSNGYASFEIFRGAPWTIPITSTVLRGGDFALNTPAVLTQGMLRDRTLPDSPITLTFGGVPTQSIRVSYYPVPNNGKVRTLEMVNAQGVVFQTLNFDEAGNLIDDAPIAPIAPVEQGDFPQNNNPGVVVAANDLNPADDLNFAAGSSAEEGPENPVNLASNDGAVMGDARVFTQRPVLAPAFPEEAGEPSDVPAPGAMELASIVPEPGLETNLLSLLSPVNSAKFAPVSTGPASNPFNGDAQIPNFVSSFPISLLRSPQTSELPETVGAVIPIYVQVNDGPQSVTVASPQAVELGQIAGFKRDLEELTMDMKPDAEELALFFQGIPDMAGLAQLLAVLSPGSTAYLAVEAEITNRNSGNRSQPQQEPDPQEEEQPQAVEQVVQDFFGLNPELNTAAAPAAPASDDAPSATT